MGKPRIALLGGHGGRSGVPRHLHQICAALKDHAELTVFTDQNQGGYDFAADLGVDHVMVHGLVSSINPIQLRRAWRALSKALDARAPFDILWAHARMTLPLARHFIRHRAMPPRLITTYHGSPFAGRGLAQRAAMRAFEWHALAVTPSHDLVFLSQGDLATFDGLPLHGHRVHIIGNCSNLGTLPDPQPAAYPTLLMTTRAAPQKNLTAAARLFAALPSDYRLVLRGPGVDTITRAQFLNHLGPQICRRITFGPSVADVRPDLRGADAYLLTSHYEGQSIGALEAFEAGLPVAMPPVGGADEMRAHHPHYAIIDPNCPTSAAADLDRLVRRFRANRSVQIAQTQAAWARVFHPTPWAARLTDLLHSCDIIPQTVFDPRLGARSRQKGDDPQYDRPTPQAPLQPAPQRVARKDWICDYPRYSENSPGQTEARAEPQRS